MIEIESLLTFAREQGASDLHLSAGAPPILRLDGTLRQTNAAALVNEEFIGLIDSLLTDPQKETLKESLEIDFSKEFSNGDRYRVNIFQQLNGWSAAFRLINRDIPTFEDLGLPDLLKSLVLRDRGLILVTGPTGCGKSTTLAAMIDYLNENTHQHIISIEDPVEYIHGNKRCLINQREIGLNTKSFRAALRSAMREDPDVILVGEMRDLETVSLALTAAETGHLVLSTLHTNSAVKSIDRVLDIFPPESKAQIRSMLSESLLGVLSQRLLANANGKGRSLALEILIANSAVRNLIREEKVYQLTNVIQSSAEEGMLTLDKSLEDLLRKGKISREQAKKVAHDPDKF